MVKTIQPDESSSSTHSTPISKNNDFELGSSTPNSSLPIENNSADAKITAQHREIERLVESRQRLHTIKDQIVSLHQSMTTPKKDFTNETKTYEDNLNDSRNIRPSYRFNHQDDNVSEIDDDTSSHQQIQPRIKQSVSLFQI
jgi:hypothetical protein